MRQTRAVSAIDLRKETLASASGFVAALLLASVVQAEDAETPRAAASPALAGQSAPPTAPRITPPRLLRFEPAVYPVDAERRGLEGTVLLALTVGDDGQVQRVELRGAIGEGFDEAAIAAAGRFQFEPATRDGRPVAAKILYRYEFKLRPKPPEAPALPQLASVRFGQVQGRLVAGSPPSPLAGVSVTIRPRLGPVTQVVTDSNGTFQVPNLVAGDYVVDVEASGYRRVSQLEQIREDTVTRIQYGLEVSDELPLEVTVRGPALHREVTHYEIPRAELLRVPGTMGDALHAVEAMPSVARPKGLSGDLVIRGSAPEDSQVLIEGTPVPQVFHFGGLSSVIPGEMLERLEFYPSNFSVRYGRVMGGIVEVRMRETNPDGRYHGSAQVDLVNARANLEGPVANLRQVSFMGGARISYLDRWLVPIMRDGASDEDGLPRYYDYQAYVEKRLPQNGVYRLGVFGGKDSFVPVLKGAKGWYVPRHDSFVHVQSQLRLPLTSDLELRATWSIGRNHRGFAEEDRSEETTEHLATLRSELSLKTASVGIARLGADVQYAPFSVAARTDSKTVGQLASTQVASPDLVRYDVRGVSVRPALYAEYELAPSRRVDITLGARVDYAKDTEQMDLAPRAAARYVLIDGPRSTVLKSGLGLFYQPPTLRQTLPELGTVGLKSSYAIHSMLGFEQSLSRAVTLSVEAFEKELRRLISEREDGSGAFSYDNAGRGRVLGLDGLLRYSADERFFGWLSYTLSRSTRIARGGEPELLDPYDQTHVLNLLGSYRFGRGWELGSRFRYATGRAYSACSGGLFDNSTGKYRCYGERRERRLGAYHQLDVRVQKTWSLSPMQLSVYLDLMNAYNYSSPDKAVENYDFSGEESLSRSMPVLPSLGIRGEI